MYEEPTLRRMTPHVGTVRPSLRSSAPAPPPAPPTSAQPEPIVMTPPSSANVAAAASLSDVPRDGDGDGNDDNPYLAMRAAKIARNERRLRELGLFVAPSSSRSSSHSSRRRHHPPSATASPPSSSSSSSSTIPPPMRRNPRRSAHRPAVPSSSPHIDTIRRSGRSDRTSSSSSSSSLAMGRGDDASAISVTPRREDVGGESRSQIVVLPPRSNIDCDLRGDDGATATPPRRIRASSVTPSTAVAPNSVRSINIDVEVLVLGGRGDEVVVDDDDNRGGGMLGRMVDGTGKECVLRTSISLAASVDDARRLLVGGTRISYNKYSGVQEWKVGSASPFFSFSPSFVMMILRSSPSPISFSLPVRPTIPPPPLSK